MEINGQVDFQFSPQTFPFYVVCFGGRGNFKVENSNILHTVTEIETAAEYFSHLVTSFKQYDHTSTAVWWQ